MACIAVIGFLGTLPYTLKFNYNPGEIIDRSLDLITITVPPALPAAMTIGTVMAISRLKKQKIFCISPPRVNISGRVNLMVFDKTGTLTEDGLQVYGFRSIIDGKDDTNEQMVVFDQFREDCQEYQSKSNWWQDEKLYQLNSQKG